MIIVKKIKAAVCLLTLIIVGFPGLKATEYKISSASELLPLSLKAGDVVIMKNGVWENQELTFEGAGTEAKPITLKAETGGEVILTGSSKIKLSGQHLVIDGLNFYKGALNSGSGAVIEFRTNGSNLAFNCRLTNTCIKDYNPPDKNTEYKWVSLYGKNNRVDHCHFEGKNHSGALLVVWLDSEPNYHKIDSNYFGERPDLGFNGAEIIRVGTSHWSMYDSYTIVENNLFEECDGEIEIISSKSCKNIYRNNTFRASEGTLTLRHGNDCEVYNNFFFGVSYKKCGGIRLIGENHKVYNNYLQNLPGHGYRAAICLVNGVPDSPLNRYFQVINGRVVNNTIVNCKHPIVIGARKDSEKTLSPKGCFIANNVIAIYDASAKQIIEYVDEPENITYQSNIMYGTELGIPLQSGIEVIDPALFQDENGVWRPADTSVVINYGSTEYDFVTFDIEMQERVSGNDAGCDQLSGNPVLNRPLKKGDVGVRWPIL